MTGCLAHHCVEIGALVQKVGSISDLRPHYFFELIAWFDQNRVFIWIYTWQTRLIVDWISAYLQTFINRWKSWWFLLSWSPQLFIVALLGDVKEFVFSCINFDDLLQQSLVLFFYFVHYIYIRSNINPIYLSICEWYLARGLLANISPVMSIQLQT